MLLLLGVDGPHAPDLGFLLHKHPARVHERDLGWGTARVVFTEDGPARATAALLVEVDPVGLVRGGSTSLEHYVSDRPYVASSLTSVALREVFSSALAGKCKDAPELASTKLPLRARVPAANVAGGAPMIERLFGPLGWTVRVDERPLDPLFPAWGAGALGFELSGVGTLHDLLTHLYVLLPVLDDEKHYFVGPDEVEKLLAHGAGWLEGHPGKELVARRYLAHQRPLVRSALAQLAADEAEPVEAREEALEESTSRTGSEPTIRLADQRIEAVLAALRDATPPIQRVVDLGCGEGRLLRRLSEERGFSAIVGVDVSPTALERAEQRLQLDRRAHLRERITLLQGSALYDDPRLHDADALLLVEVIEHLELDRLDLVAKVLFERLRPRRLVLTTPNREYNARFEALAPGALRHDDHRFEWTRSELRAWCEAEVTPRGYAVRYVDVGPTDPELGAPTQMAICDRGAP